MEQIPIVYYITEDFLELTMNSINYVKKFFKNKDKYKLQFYIASPDTFDIPDDIIFKHIPLEEESIDRFLIDRINLFDNFYDQKRIIFLDSDTITTTCISKLWETDLEDNVVGGCVHYYYDSFGTLIRDHNIFNISEFSTQSLHTFFNCGVFIVDTVKWSVEKISEKALDIWKLYNHDEGYYRYDEPALNAALIDRIKELDKLWNYYPFDAFKRSYIAHYYGEDITNIPKYNWHK